MRYAITIKGRVQNKSYIFFVECHARIRKLGGFVFNDSDGTVKVICDGSQQKVDEFIDVINLHEEDIFVEDILKEETDASHPIPGIFGHAVMI